METVDERLNNAFGVAPSTNQTLAIQQNNEPEQGNTTVIISQDPTIALISDEMEAKKDLIDSIKRNKELIYKAHEALKDAMSLAQSSEEPRAWEVVNQILNTLKDLNAQILQMHKDHATIKKIGMVNKPQLDPTETPMGYLTLTSDVIRQIERERGERL